MKKVICISLKLIYVLSFFSNKIIWIRFRLVGMKTMSLSGPRIFVGREHCVEKVQKGLCIKQLSSCVANFYVQESFTKVSSLSVRLSHTIDSGTVSLVHMKFGGVD